MSLELREVVDADLPIFFEQQLDPEANWMAAFTGKDPADRVAFERHWERIRKDPAIIIRTIVAGGQVAGHVSSYVEEGEPEVTYWLGRSFWGRGVASRSLRLFLDHVNHERPMRARVAKDNVASLTVLRKCGFEIVGEDRGYANARTAETEEFVLRLEAALHLDGITL